MTKDIALCRSEGLAICQHCIRNADNHVPGPFQQFIKPNTNGTKCSDWKGAPSKTKVIR